jgi:regulator of protease activity HflC (stomatin/prohibitin superfamily)
MAIKAVIGFLIGLCALGVVAGAVLAGLNATRGRKARPGIVLAVAAFVGVLIMAPLNAGLVLIQPNEIGVVFRQTASGDRALLEPLQSGLKWVVPFVDQVIVYDAGQQSVTMAGGATEDYTQQGMEGQYSAVRAISKDGQIIFLDVTVIFRIDPTKINAIHRSWRDTYAEGFIVPQTRSEVRNAVSSYGAEEIYSGQRAALETEVAESLRAAIATEGFLLTDFLVRDISFSQQFAEAIEQKQIAEQQAQQAERRVEQARQEAEQARVEAQGRADAAVIAAEGEAESITIRAQAEAEALRLINEQLSQNPLLIQWRYIDELGEDVRLIIIPSNSPFLFDLQALLAQLGAETTTEPLLPPAPSGGEEGGGEGGTP